jgi:hypothetical protein
LLLGNGADAVQIGDHGKFGASDHPGSSIGPRGRWRDRFPLKSDFAAIGAVARDVQHGDLAAEVLLPLSAKKALAVAAAKRKRADSLAKESQEAARTAARILTKTGLSLRDVGRLLGVTRQRAHQLIGN